MPLTIEAPNGGDDRASAAPASHRSNDEMDDTDDERGVTRTYALRCDDFFARSASSNPNETNE